MTDVKELLSKVEDEELRKQLGEQYDALAGSTLRKQLDEALTENKTLKTEKRHGIYAEANLPEGAYDIFDEKYDGELSVDGLQTFAKEKGFALPDSEPNDGGDGGDPTPANEPTGDDRLRQAAGGQLPVRDPSDQDKSAQALSDGDTTTAIKHQLVAMHKAQ